MNARLTVSKSVLGTLFAALAAGFLGTAAPYAQAQFLPDPMLLDSFEGTGGGVSDWFNASPPPDSWDWDPITTGTNPNYVSHSQSSTGVTHGSSSLLLEMRDGGSTWGLSLTTDSLDDSGLYEIFNTVAADESAWLLEMDMTLDASSWENVSAPAGPPFTGFWSLNMGLNADVGGSGTFGQSAVSGQLFGQTSQYKLRVPMTNLVTDFPVDADSYQILLGNSQGLFVSGDGVDPVNPGEGMKVYLDNLRFVPATPSISETLFSWEGSFEGWDDDGLGEDHANAHVHALVSGSDAATDGTDTLSIDTSIQDPLFDPNGPDPPTEGIDYGFYWGSTYRLNADTNDDGEVDDPVAAAKIAELIPKLNAANAIAFDIHYNDVLDSNVNPFAISGAWSRLAVHVNDGTGAFFDEEGPAINPPAEGDPDGETFEYLVNTADMVSNCDTGDPWCGESLASLGATATNSLTLGIAVNSDGAVNIEIDNFRLIMEVDLSADFDNDGDVDGNDLAIWETNLGTVSGAGKSTGDADLDGDTDGGDFLHWQLTAGTDATGGVESLDMSLFSSDSSAGVVPEPASALMLALGALVVGVHHGRRRD